MTNESKKNTEKKANSEIQALSFRLQSIQDKAHLKAHLASMDAKKSWNQISKSVQKLGKKLRNLKNTSIKESEQARVQFQLGIMEAKDYWDELQVHFDPLKKDLKKVKTEIDHARVQAHLASMDSKEAFAMRVKKVKSIYENNLSLRVNDVLAQLKHDFEKIDKNLSE